MRRSLLLSSFFLLLAFVAGPALALPAPMSDDELLAKSDLVALIRVLSVTCTGVDKDERTGEALPSYKANAELMEVVKGDVAKGDDLSITFPAVPTGLLGPWTVYYYPGEMVFTHLVATAMPIPRPGGTAAGSWSTSPSSPSCRLRPARRSRCRAAPATPAIDDA